MNTYFRRLPKTQPQQNVPLRGLDVIRIHCKKWEQLCQIEEVLKKVDKYEKFTEISLPISMKTKSQKKGFFVYLRFENNEVAGNVLHQFAQSAFSSIDFKTELGMPNLKVWPHFRSGIRELNRKKKKQEPYPAFLSRRGAKVN